MSTALHLCASVAPVLLHQEGLGSCTPTHAHAQTPTRSRSHPHPHSNAHTHTHAHAYARAARAGTRAHASAPAVLVGALDAVLLEGRAPVIGHLCAQQDVGALPRDVVVAADPEAGLHARVGAAAAAVMSAASASAAAMPAAAVSARGGRTWVNELTEHVGCRGVSVWGIRACRDG